MAFELGNAFAGKEKTGADGRDRSLLSERGSFAYCRKVPMVVKAAGESTGGEQLASSGQAVGKGRQAVGKRWLKAGGECIRGEFASLRIGDRVSVSSVRSGIIQSSRRFEEDAEAEVHLGRKSRISPYFWICELCRSDPDDLLQRHLFKHPFDL